MYQAVPYTTKKNNKKKRAINFFSQSEDDQHDDHTYCYHETKYRFTDFALNCDKGFNSAFDDTLALKS